MTKFLQIGRFAKYIDVFYGQRLTTIETVIITFKVKFIFTGKNVKVLIKNT